MRALVILTVAAALLTAACAGAGGGGQPDPTTAASPASEPPSSEAQAQGDTITGTLGGDAQLEGGCVWVEAGSTRWQVLWPDGYTVGTDPIVVTGPDGESIAEGDTVTVAGAEQTDIMTTCQVGPVWAATSVTAEG